MSNGFSKIAVLVIAFSLLSVSIFSQTTGLPRLRKGETYKSVRTKLLKAGWKPYHDPNADKCEQGDNRCKGRPEMQFCSGTGVAACRFLWKRKGKTVAIFTAGEDEAIYNGYEIVE